MKTESYSDHEEESESSWVVFQRRVLTIPFLIIFLMTCMGADAAITYSVLSLFQMILVPLVIFSSVVAVLSFALSDKAPGKLYSTVKWGSATIAALAFGLLIYSSLFPSF